MIDIELENRILSSLIYSKNEKIQINTCRVKKTWIDQHISSDAYDYLLNRFPDLNSIKNIPEVLYRIYYKIDNAPLCNVCHEHPCKFIGFNHGYSKTCSYKCSINTTINDTIIESHEKLLDNDILNHFIKNNRIISTYATKLHCQQHGYLDYLYNRFSDISENDSIQEILYRIKNKIEKKPTCIVCGKPVNFLRFKDGYRQYCSITCAKKSDEYYQHKRETRNISRENSWKKRGYNIKFDTSDIYTYLVYDKCVQHNPFKINATTFFNRCNDPDIVMCPICNPERNPETSIETIIKDILDSNNIKYDQHNRTIIHPKEIDFYLSDFKIGIECNGIYWHSGEAGKERTNAKYRIAKENNIQLLTFWEDDIHLKKDIIESIIKTKCGLNKKVYARKCQIKEIDSKLSKDFINKNHLQGNINASIRLGLFYNNELLEVMTFGKLRKSLGLKAKNGIFELYRLCTKQGYSIIGGASKLLSYFKNNYNWNEIISYCHNEISSGSVYEKLGFLFDKECGNGYSYYNYKINNHRINRFNLRKSEIDDNSGRTSDEILASNNYLKCYDAGVKKYKLINEKQI